MDWLEEGRVNNNLQLKEVTLLDLCLGEANLNLFLALLKSLGESIDPNSFEDTFGLVILNLLNGVDDSDGEFPLTEQLKFNIVLAVPELVSWLG